MNISDLNLISETISEVLSLATTIHSMLKRLGPFRIGGPPCSYDNISLALLLTIQDRRGQKAELRRRQVVEFTSMEAGVLRDLVWGDGNTLSSYKTIGARLVGKRREGSKDALLLMLPERTAAGQRTVVRSSRIVLGALTRRTEYFEVQVERHTRRLALRVSFPKERPPLRAWVVSTPYQSPLSPLRTRHGPDGKTSLCWSLKSPKLFHTYRLSWTW